MNEQNIIERMNNEKFASDNGTILRALNIIGASYKPLAQLGRALETEMNASEFAESINYMSLAGYILLRRCANKQTADIADNDIEELEAKLSDEGIRLLRGRLTDDCVRA